MDGGFDAASGVCDLPSTWLHTGTPVNIIREYRVIVFWSIGMESALPSETSRPKRAPSSGNICFCTQCADWIWLFLYLEGQEGHSVWHQGG